jgi:hypothetical protein
MLDFVIEIEMTIPMSLEATTTTVIFSKKAELHSCGNSLLHESHNIITDAGKDAVN